MFTITGTVGTDGKYLVTGMPVDTEAHAVLKLAFENNTLGTNLSLCAGSDADFSAGTAGITLSDSGGPGFKFLTIIDTHALSGKILYVLRVWDPQTRSSLSQSTKQFAGLAFRVVVRGTAY